jgi:preprotein translocase subunit SecD
MNNKQRGIKMKTRGKSTALFLVVAIIISILAYLGAYGAEIGDYKIKSFGETIKRGLDLQGGVSVLMEIASEEKVPQDDLDRTVELLRMRVNKIGVSETSVTVEGTKRIRVDVPGKSDSASIIDTLKRTGELRFVGPDNEVILTGKDVSKAAAYIDEFGKPTIGLELNDEGTKKFADATQKFLGQNIAIFMDEEQLTNPTVQAVITTGKAIITGNRSLEEAKRISGIIQSGALPVTLTTLSVRTVGPTLGKEAIPLSVKAGTIGISLVFLFMLIYYRVPGLMANLALTLYIILVLLTFVTMGATLTLPGIAGFLLTIGMAVDANVLIFERIKEELKTGKSVKSAMNSGFHRALTSILDSNITTIIAGIILYSFGSGPVKGFALTLMIGIILSMISAITVTKMFIRLAVNMGIQNTWLYGVKRG